MGLWVRSFHVFQEIIDGVHDGEGKVITLVLGLGSYWVLSCPHHQSEVSGIAVANLPLAAMNEE